MPPVAEQRWENVASHTLALETNKKWHTMNVIWISWPCLNERKGTEEVLFYHVSESEEQEKSSDEQFWPFTGFLISPNIQLFLFFFTHKITLITKGDSSIIPSGQSIKWHGRLYLRPRCGFLWSLRDLWTKKWSFSSTHQHTLETEAENLPWTLLFRIKNRNFTADIG